MNKPVIVMLVLALVAVVAIACAPAPTSVPPTAVPTAVPATKAPEATKPPAPTAVPATTAPTTVPPTVAPTTVPATNTPAAPKPADANTLLVLKVATAPKLDALADDAAWKTAPELKISAAGGKNFKDGSTSATLKAVYTSDSIYFLLQYDDPTQSIRRLPFIKQPDGSWKKLLDPDDPTNTDNNKYYEDKFAMIWTINNSIKGFDTAGCFAVCHAGEPNKPYGNKYSAAPGELGDIWHLKSIRTGSVGQIDDQYLDDTRWDKDKAPEAGRKSDAKTAGGYADMNLKDGKPEFMNKDAKPANAGGTYFLKDADKVAFDDSKFKAGDEVASILVAPITGDRGDITVSSTWKDGKWTFAFSRKLVTGSKTDVQFDKLDGTNYFGIAFFDNAQVRHAFNTGALKLQFAK